MLGNFKIKVNNESESKEAQELFFELGYYWVTGTDVANFEAKFLFVKNNKITMSYCSDHFSDNNSCEITLNQLKDMVVLHRNDVNDATHEFVSGSKVYVSSDDVCYEYIDSNWVMFTTGSNGVVMKPIKAETEQGLINGVDAFNSKMAGEAVLWKTEGGDWQEWTDVTSWSKSALTGGKYSFKIKPQTIKLSLEIPAPFEPKEDCNVFILNDSRPSGYQSYEFDVTDTKAVFFGVWRTEEDIKKVVEALRNGIKGVDNV